VGVPTPFSVPPGPPGWPERAWATRRTDVRTCVLRTMGDSALAPHIPRSSWPPNAASGHSAADGPGRSGSAPSPNDPDDAAVPPFSHRWHSDMARARPTRALVDSDSATGADCLRASSAEQPPNDRVRLPVQQYCTNCAIVPTPLTPTHQITELLSQPAPPLSPPLPANSFTSYCTIVGRPDFRRPYHLKSRLTACILHFAFKGQQLGPGNSSTP